MITKFSCPRCDQHISADSTEAGIAGSCPHCGELVIVPAAQAAPLPPQHKKTFEDYAADGICATANVTGKAGKLVAKVGWKAAKVVAPVGFRIAGKVAGRAAHTAASTKAGQHVVEGARWLVKPPEKPPNKAVQFFRCIALLWRIFGG